MPSLSGPQPVLSAQLYRLDEGDGLGAAEVYLKESGMALDPLAVDMLIADLEAFAAKLRVMRRQMGA